MMCRNAWKKPLGTLWLSIAHGSETRRSALVEGFKVTEISVIEIERILLKRGHRYRIGNDGLLC